MPDRTVSNHKSSMPPSAVAIALFICVLFGGNQVASKIALQQFTPMLCAALAFSLSSIALLVYACYTEPEWQVSDRKIWRNKLPFYLQELKAMKLIQSIV